MPQRIALYKSYLLIIIIIIIVVVVVVIVVVIKTISLDFCNITVRGEVTVNN